MQDSFTRLAVTAIGHLVGTLVVAAVMLWLTAGGAAGHLASAITSGAVGGSPAPAILLHLAISATLWAGIYLIVSRLMKREEKEKRVIKLQSGTAMTELLIIITPFLLLTSGLSQLAILNTAGLLSDVAIYNASRATWVWDVRPDADSRVTQRKGRLAAALTLAPTAPSDYHVDQINGTVRELVEELGGSGSATGVGTAEHEDMFFNVAYDTGTMEERISNKVFFAYHATAVEFSKVDYVTPEGRTVPGIQTDLTYQMNIVFPWFAYIWGQRTQVAGREGYYSSIERRHTLPEQVQEIDP